MKEIENTTIGTRLKRAREHSGKAQKEVAMYLASVQNRDKELPEYAIEENIEKCLQRYRKWEYGTNAISARDIHLLCDFFNVEVGYLFGEFDDFTRETSDAAMVTGLSSNAVARLCSYNTYYLKNKDKLRERIPPLEIVSDLLTDPEFWRAINDASLYTDPWLRPFLQSGEVKPADYSDPYLEIAPLNDSEAELKCMMVANHITNAVMRKLKPKLIKEVSTDAE